MAHELLRSTLIANIEVTSEVTGTVWKIDVHEGQHVSAGDVLIVIESMKMEIAIVAEVDAVVLRIDVEEQAAVSEGQTIAILQTGATA